MNKKFDIKLNIPKGQVISHLKEKVFYEELQNINSIEAIEENQINLAISYILYENNKLEVGFFIRNTLKSAIALENVELAIQDSKGNIIADLKCNLNGLGSMPSYTGTPCNLEFKLNKGNSFNSNEKYRIIFNTHKEMKSLKAVKADIENIPMDIPFEDEEAIRRFEKGLDILKKDEINIDVFKAERINNDSIDITLLIRNGYDKEIRLERLPLTIINSNNYPVCKHIFYDSNGLVNVGAQRAKILKLSIDKSKIYNTVFDLNKCKILFQ